VEVIHVQKHPNTKKKTPYQKAHQREVLVGHVLTGVMFDNVKKNDGVSGRSSTYVRGDFFRFGVNLNEFLKKKETSRNGRKIELKLEKRNEREINSKCWDQSTVENLFEGKAASYFEYYDSISLNA
jgi:hypothetical protein